MTRLSTKSAQLVMTITFVFVMLCPTVRAQDAAALAQYQKIQALPWKFSPNVLRIESVATIDLGSSMKYLGPEGTSTLLAITYSTPGAGNYTLAPKDDAWWAVFNYEATGHISDDEKIDPASLLSTLKEINRQEREERRKDGRPDLVLDGWAVPPHYEKSTHNLEWGVNISYPGGRAINYTVRILSREGVIASTLVTDVDGLDSNLLSFRSALRDLKLINNQSYFEFRDGDKIAGYGLTALILGGITVAATKLGFLQNSENFLCT